MNINNNILSELKSWFELSRDCILDRFASEFPNADDRGSGDCRFVYVPGSRSHRVLLVAHADSVWDDRENFPAPVELHDGYVRSSDPSMGIGADDRAGCAILWQLRDLGHSLLITSGEEKGCLASRWLMESHADLVREINGTHRFVVQFDRRGRQDFKCYHVGTDSFRAYCRRMTGFTEPNRTAFTDIGVLCERIPGVNLSSGYYHEHTEAECLRIADWSQTLGIARLWLSERVLPQFHLYVHGDH